MPYVQGATANTTNGTTAATFGSSTTSTNLIVVTTSDDSGTTANGMAVSDSKGNSYTKAIHSAGSSTLSMWYAFNVTGGASHTVTATWSTSATGRCAIAVQEFSGIQTSSPLDKSTSTSGSSTSPSSGATAATTQADELVVGGMSHAGTVSTISLGSGYANLSKVDVANAAVGQESKVVAATGAQTSTFSIAASRDWVCGVLTFKASTASPQTVSPSSIGSAEAVGTPTVTSTIAVSPTGIPTVEAFGTPVLTAGPPTIGPTGIASGEAFGSPVLTPGPVTVGPSGITSAESVGTPTVTSSVAFSPAGLASEETFGVPVLTLVEPIYRLIAPVVDERFGEHIAFLHRTALTVYGTGAGLTAAMMPKADALEGATHIFYGGHEYTTTDIGLRDLWVSSGFDVERVA